MRNFLVIQALDVATTLLAIHAGGFEANPIVARLIAVFGIFGGLLLSKMFISLVAMRVKKLLWVASFVYLGIVFWNLLILFLL